MIVRVLSLFSAFSITAAATVVSTGAIRQPVNLGPAADPGRIPLGSVPCESNHGYGVVELITKPFPLVHGGWRWDGGIELNGNLPSAFGISIEPEDSTNVPGSPVKVRVRRQAKPAYSPYDKEQVLLATLRCLLDSVAATTRVPLVIEVVTEDPEDEGLQRFSGEYVTRPLEDEDLGPTPLPGCRVEVDEDGVAAVVFEGIEPREEKLKPVWLPFPIEGDADPGHLLLPLWTGNEFKNDRLELVGMPWPVVQVLFNPASGDPDANSLTRGKWLGNFGVTRTEELVKIYAYLTRPQDVAGAREMALLCWAAVLSERPTAELPLEVVLRIHGTLDEVFQEWVEKGGWELVEFGSDQAIRETFVWDRAGKTLVSGRIPGIEVVAGENGGWEVVGVGALPEKPGSKFRPH